jgi:hypothetical protein
MVRQLASMLGAIVLVAACTRNEGEVAQTRAEGSSGGADGTQTEGGGSPEAGIAGCVVFDADWDIYVANADGSGLKRLTTSTAREFDPSWSPEGAKIAYRYEPGDDASAEIYVMGRRRLGRSRLTAEVAVFSVTSAAQPPRSTQLPRSAQVSSGRTIRDRRGRCCGSDGTRSRGRRAASIRRACRSSAHTRPARRLCRRRR